MSVINPEEAIYENDTCAARLHRQCIGVGLGSESAWDGEKLVRLVSTLPTTYKVWADRIVEIDTAKTIGALLERYFLEVVPTKEISTQTHNRAAIKTPRAVYADMNFLDLKLRHIYQYIEKRSAKTSVRW